MKVGRARAIAAEWLAGEIERRRGGGGEVAFAFTAGSVNRMAEGDEFPPTSDLDLCVVLDEAGPDASPEPGRVEKLAYRGLVLEPAFAPRSRFATPEAALADFAYACHLAAPSSLYDPRGELRALREAMADRYPRPEWILARCAAARDHSLALAARAGDSDSLCFVAAVLTHAVQGMAQMVLLADLQAPTVKKALVRASEALERRGMAGTRDGLLRLLGSERLDRARIEAMAARCATALREAAPALRTRFPADNAVTLHMLPSLEAEASACFAEGRSREYCLWIAHLHSLSLYVLGNDGSWEARARLGAAYAEDMAALGLPDAASARARLAEAVAGFGGIMRACEGIAAPPRG